MTPTPPDNLSAADWARVRALFALASDLPANERAEFVCAAGERDAVCDEVLALLMHSGDEVEEAFLDAPAAATLLPPASNQHSRDGLQLGAWQLDGLLGSGGMGEVYRAHRADGAYSGGAAVKILKRGMDSLGVLQRFAQEQQALATLNHPHIARLFDAGLTPDRLPYFVMELVDGQPIDAACAGLPLAGRLALFLQLTDAVAHAHRKLLVHRDLKPGNVLVTTDGQVKLLDFGIAKALDSDEAAAIDITSGSQRPFTPSHASPEQVRGERVGTATDIYSLGVLLYQLLTGQRPYGRGATSPAEAARAVLEEQPTRPSSLPAPADDGAWLATRDKLRGDLDNILLKALEKPVERRYASVDAVAADVRAYLAGYPVSAREPKRSYVFAKFAARNRVAVGAASFGLVALLAGLAGTAWQAQRAQSRLKDIRSISSEVVMRYGDAITHLPGGMKLKEKLLTDTVVYLDRLSKEADDDLAFKGEIGMAYSRLADIQVSNTINSLGDDAAGDRNAARALALLEPAEAAAPKDPLFYLLWARALRSRAMVARGNARVDDALALLARAPPVLARGLKRFPGNADLRSELGSILFLTGQANDSWFSLASKGRGDEALRYFDRAQAVYSALAAQFPRGEEAHTYPFQLGTIEGARALVLAKRQQPAQAVVHLRANIAFNQQAIAMDPDNATARGGLAIAANNLAAMCLDIDDAACALQASELGWATLAKLRREEAANPGWLNAQRGLALHHGRALLAGGDAAAALPVLKQSADWLQAVLDDGKAGPPQRRRLAATQIAQAGALQQLGRADEAAQRAESARALLVELTGKTPADGASWLLLGDLSAGRAAVAGARRDEWLSVGRQAYAKAAALQPLIGHHLAQSKRLGA